jgi:hypothetical protein
MGLDMYAYMAKDFKPSKPVDFQDEIPSEVQELFYWRKHPDMHGLMESIYREKGGDAESFNCVPVQITEDDLERIASHVIDETLPETQGFFFGESTEEDRDDDIQFLKKAREAISSGYTIWYDSWW